MNHELDAGPINSTAKIAAAQYLRMSTEAQQYSADNQAAVIRRYADDNRFEIVATYSDDGKSGLTADGRQGLLQLINDVECRRCNFAAILVYDVSRWGRFQNPDDAAVFEVRCRWAGVPVHYVAEQFENDGSIISSILKTLKRAMAAEYSRELSVKVHEGHVRMLKRGYHQGGFPCFGLQRVLIDVEGNRKQVLRFREHKNIQSDRVILEPGPPEHIAIVQEVYRRYLEGDNQSTLVTALNKRGDFTASGRPWTHGSMRRLLTSECYIGNIVWGKFDGKLGRSRKAVPEPEWIRQEAAFPSLIEPSLFWKVQAEVKRRAGDYSNEEILSGLRRLLKKHGTINRAIINEEHGMASAPAIGRRFGSLKAAYAGVGFQSVPNNKYTKINRRMAVIATKLANDIAKRLGGGFHIEQTGSACQLHRDGFIYTLLLGRYIDRMSGPEQWYFEWEKLADADVAIIGKMAKHNEKVREYSVVRRSDIALMDLRFRRSDGREFQPYRHNDFSSCITELGRQMPIRPD